MRYCLVDDLLTGARVLSGVPAAHRAKLAEQLLGQAHAADLYAKRFGKPHPRWGNGSLMARALVNAPSLETPQTCYASIAVMAEAIAQFQHRIFTGARVPERVCPRAAPYASLDPSMEGEDGRNQDKTQRD